MSLEMKHIELAQATKLDRETLERIREFFKLVGAHGLKPRLCADQEYYEIYGPADEFVSRRPIGILMI